MTGAVTVADRTIEQFIARWQGLEGGRERANYALFLIELAEVFADFTGQGKNYQQVPDRNGFRIYLEELRGAGLYIDQ